ncbi:MAG: GNAT family N-acetyltransferase [Alphaproteobacteria bacterium]|nr:GNAT family N-acetyltransferase [Alphaproteobacteria bacterium]
MTKLTINEARSPRHIEAVERLLRDYLLWMRRRYHAHLDMIDAYFDEREWQSELADLPGHYGQPHGAIVLALVDGQPAGCVVMRGIGFSVAEMRRLFVRPAFRGMGVARRMIDTLLDLSCRRGYSLMRFEAVAFETEVELLCDVMGFRRIAPYYACPEWLERRAHFFEAGTCTAGQTHIAA